MAVPDLAFSGAANISDSWTCQQLANRTPAVNLGYDAKAPGETRKEEDKNGK